MVGGFSDRGSTPLASTKICLKTPVFRQIFCIGASLLTQCYRDETTKSDAIKWGRGYFEDDIADRR